MLGRADRLAFIEHWVRKVFSRRTEIFMLNIIYDLATIATRKSFFPLGPTKSTYVY